MSKATVEREKAEGKSDEEALKTAAETNELKRADAGPISVITCLCYAYLLELIDIYG